MHFSIYIQLSTRPRRARAALGSPVCYSSRGIPRRIQKLHRRDVKIGTSFSRTQAWKLYQVSFFSSIFPGNVPVFKLCITLRSEHAINPKGTYRRHRVALFIAVLQNLSALLNCVQSTSVVKTTFLKKKSKSQNKQVQVKTCSLKRERVKQSQEWARLAKPHDQDWTERFNQKPFYTYLFCSCSADLNVTWTGNHMAILR